MENKSVILGIFVIIGLISFAGIAFADTEIGDRIAGVGGTIINYFGNISNTTGYPYYNLTSIPINITHNDTINNFTVNQTFNEGINTKLINVTGNVFLRAENQTASDLKSPNTFSLVKYLVVYSDSYSMWDGTTATLPMSGYYSITATLRLLNITSTAGSTFQGIIYLNGVAFRRLNVANRSKVYNGALLTGGVTTYFNKSDTIQIYSYVDDYYEVFGDGTNHYTTLDIVKVG